MPQKFSILDLACCHQAPRKTGHHHIILFWELLYSGKRLGVCIQKSEMEKTYHIIQPFSWGQCQKCSLQHVYLSFLLLTYRRPQRWSCPTLPMRGCSTVSFIWLSAKGFYSQVLFCSQKWVHKRAPSNFTYIFPVYQNCIYLFLWLRHTCTISIPVICTEQIQFRSNKLASIPSCMWPIVPQSVRLVWWNCIGENKAAQLFLKAHFKLLGLNYMWKYVKKQTYKQTKNPQITYSDCRSLQWYD